MNIQTLSMLKIILTVTFSLLFNQTFLAAIGYSLTENEFSPQKISNSFLKSDEQLRPNKLYISQLEGNKQDLFSVKATKGQCLRFIFEQKGIDIMIALRNSEQETLKKVDRPSGSYGRESFTFISPGSGVFEIVVTAWRADAINGKYQFSYTVSDTPTENNRQRNKAENLVSEAELLRNSRLKENKEKALIKFDQALQIWENLGEIYEQAVVYYGIGFTHYSLSNHYQAARYYNRAVRLHLQIGDKFGQAINYSALGSVKYALNNNEFSAYYYKKAIEIYKSIENARGLGVAYHGLGVQQFLSEDYSEAIKTLTESLKWRILANDTVGNARTHISLAKLYLLIENEQKTEEHLIKASKVFGKKRAENDAELNYYFGKFYLLRNNPQTSLNFFEKALDLSTQIGNKLGIALTLVELSRVYTKLKNYEKALENIRRAVSIIEVLRQSTLDFRERISFTASLQPFYEQYILLLMKMHKHSSNKGFDKRALEISEQSRARGMLDQLERRELIRKNSISSDLLIRKQSLQDKLSSILIEQSKKSESRLTDDFLEISSEYTEVEAEISLKFTSSATASLPTLKSTEIQSYLDKDTTLLEYWITEEESFLFLVTRENIESYELENGKKIESLAKDVFGCISKPTNNGNCRQKNRELSNILIGSIAKDIKNKRLIIVKKGYLQYIPFSALKYPESENYLIERNEIVSLPSVSLLKYLNKTNSSKTKKNLAVFADPIYSFDDGRIVNKDLSINKDRIYLPRLFATRFESQAIASFFNPETILVKTDSEANRQAIFNSDLKDYRIVHFATHAIIDDQTPELSAIVLSLYDKNGIYTDGFLRLNDILRLDLNSDLVVLSSCQSAVGKQVKGEGLASLSNSFFASGANSLLSSLWEVNDKATAEFMKRFYQKHILEKKNLSTALRETQLDIMKDKRWSSPFYWSAFTLQGN